VSALRGVIEVNRRRNKVRSNASGYLTPTVFDADGGIVTKFCGKVSLLAVACVALPGGRENQNLKGEVIGGTWEA